MKDIKQGAVKYRKKIYDYTIYFMPLTPETESEVIQFFGNRFRDGKRCLGVDENYIENNIRNNSSVAYIKVNERGFDDYATASLKMINWCVNGPAPPQAFIMALCRTGSQKSLYSPILILFKLLEQLTIQQYKKSHLYLFPQKGDGMQKLIEIYRNYGFSPTECILPGEYVLRKKNRLDRKFISYKENHAKASKRRTLKL
jgi:hypothetical protein